MSDPEAVKRQTEIVPPALFPKAFESTSKMTFGEGGEYVPTPALEDLNDPNPKDPAKVARGKKAAKPKSKKGKK